MGAAGIIQVAGMVFSLIGNIWGAVKSKKDAGQTTGQAISGTLAQYGSNYSPYSGVGSSGVGIVATPQGVGISTSLNFTQIVLYGGIIAMIIYLLKR
jgi:hypothetical protein